MYSKFSMVVDTNLRKMLVGETTQTYAMRVLGFDEVPSTKQDMKKGVTKIRRWYYPDKLTHTNAMKIFQTTTDLGEHLCGVIRLKDPMFLRVIEIAQIRKVKKIVKKKYQMMTKKKVVKRVK